MVFLYVGGCLLVVATCGAFPATSNVLNDGYPGQDQSLIKGQQESSQTETYMNQDFKPCESCKYNNDASNRWRRTLSNIMRISDFARKFLIQGAKVVKKLPNTRVVEKAGNYKTAKHDFFYVAPTDVRQYRLKDGGVVLEGKIGDRKMTLTSRSNGSRPVLEIFERDRLFPLSGGQPVDSIFYKRKVD